MSMCACHQQTIVDSKILHCCLLASSWFVRMSKSLKLICIVSKTEGHVPSPHLCELTSTDPPPPVYIRRCDPLVPPKFSKPPQLSSVSSLIPLALWNRVHHGVLVQLLTGYNSRDERLWVRERPWRFPALH